MLRLARKVSREKRVGSFLCQVTEVPRSASFVQGRWLFLHPVWEADQGHKVDVQFV